MEGPPPPGFSLPAWSAAVICEFSAHRHCPELMPLEQNERGCQRKGGCPGERLPGVERRVERRMARRMARTRRTKGRVEENAPTW